MRDRVVFVGKDEDAAKLRAALAREVEFAHLDPGAASKEIEGKLPALLIFGFGEPWRDQWEALPSLYSACLRHPLRSLALVPRNDAAALELAFAHGVADCAAWPIDPVEVAARARVLLQRRRLADRRRAEAQESRRDAETDDLTGLGNRRMLAARLGAAMARARAKAQPLALLMLDIDGMKPINDRLGHHAGDLVLCGVGATLSANVRAGDTVARYGGDELAVVMPDADLATAHAIAARLCAVVADLSFGDGIRTTVSIGVAALVNGDADANALIRRADSALYAAKRAGRNRVAPALAAA